MDIEARIRDSFAAQTMMATLGAELVSVGVGAVEIALPASPGVRQQHGFVHGGAVMAIADTAAGYAAVSTLDADTEALTVEFKLNCLRPVEGDALAKAKVVRTGRSIIVSACDVFCGDKHVATGLGTFAVVPNLAHL